MADRPSPEEIALWQRRLAAQANNRAWRLSESLERTSEDDEEMLQAAYASNYFWRIVGTENNKAHAAQLLAHVHALLGRPTDATRYWSQAEPVFLGRECQPWERACAFAIKASVASAAGQRDVHSSSYAEAERLIAALPDPEDREILYATLRVVPRPSEA